VEEQGYGIFLNDQGFNILTVSSILLVYAKYSLRIHIVKAGGCRFAFTNINNIRLDGVNPSRRAASN
jgi:hypothetical protein